MEIENELTVKEAMDWALVDGNSTAISDYPRGVGFTQLESFICGNQGKITICSGEGIYNLEKGKKTFYKLKNPLKGTLFIMKIKACEEE